MFETNAIYNKCFPLWQKCIDAVAGEDAIKEKSKVYLPMPSGMDSEDYKGNA